MGEQQGGAEPQTETQAAEPHGQPSGAPAGGGGQSAQSVGEQVQDALASGQITEADLGRKVRVKVDGAEREITLGQALRDYELRSASHKRLEEAARTRKEVDAEREQIKQIASLLRDPAGLLSMAAELGVPLQELRDHLERELSTPDDVKRLRDIERRERALREREESEKRQREQARLDAETRAARERYVAEGTQALESVGLPKSPALMQAMFRLMHTAHEAGAPITAREAAESVAEELRGMVGSVVRDADETGLRRLLGDDKVEALRKAEVQRATSARNAVRPQAPRGRAQNPTDAQPRRNLGAMTPDEWSAYLDEQQRGRGR